MKKVLSSKLLSFSLNADPNLEYLMMSTHGVKAEGSCSHLVNFFYTFSKTIFVARPWYTRAKMIVVALNVEFNPLIGI